MRNHMAEKEKKQAISSFILDMIARALHLKSNHAENTSIQNPDVTITQKETVSS